MQRTFQLGRVGCSMARLVLPQAEGKAAETNRSLPAGLVRPMISMCSAIQPSSRAITPAIRRAKHFLPNRLLPP